MSHDIIDATSARVAPGSDRDALRAVPVLSRALVATPRRRASLSVHDAGDCTPVDLALVAVAAADAWATGAGLPPPRGYLARRLLAACKRVAARHRIFVTPSHHARARRSMTAMADAINAIEPSSARAAVLCAVLLDLLNDREAHAFGAVSDELSRVDRECHRPEGVDIERIAAEIADRVREEHGR